MPYEKIRVRISLEPETVPAASKPWAPLNNRLPLEMLIRIFQYLANDCQDMLPLPILVASLVCTNWQAAADIVIDQSIKGDIKDDFYYFLSLMEQCSSMKVGVLSITLQLGRCVYKYYDDSSNINRRSLTNVITRLGRMFNEYDLSETCFSIENGQQLEYTESPSLFENNFIAESKVRWLGPFQTNPMPKKYSLKNLQKIVILNDLASDILLNNQLLVLAHEAINILHLEITDFREISDGIEVKDIHWPKLQFFGLYRNPQLTCRLLYTVVMACPKLDSIDLHMSKSLECAEFPAVGNILQERGFSHDYGYPYFCRKKEGLQTLSADGNWL